MRKELRPSGIAGAISFGIVMGVFPIYGPVSLLCLALAALFRLNLPTAFAAYYSMTFTKPILIIPFLRIGEFLFQADPMPLSLAQLTTRFVSDTLGTLSEFGWSFVHAMKWRHVLTAIAGLGMVSGCSTTYPRLTQPDEEYRMALQATSRERPEDPDLALQAVIDLFSDFSEQNLRNHVRNVYAEHLYFRDGFKKLKHLCELEPYLVHSTEPLRSCTFSFDPPVRNPPDYYLRWTMKVNLRRDKPEQIDEVIGLSHLRFNREGKVVFQQDYWDPTDVLYRRIPIANRLIALVRSKL